MVLTQGITQNSSSSWETRYDNICVFWDRLGSLNRYRSYVFQTLFECSAREFWIKCFFSWDQSQNNWDIAYSQHFFFLPKWWSNQSMLRHWGLNRVLRKGSRICNLKVDGPWDFYVMGRPQVVPLLAHGMVKGWWCFSGWRLQHEVVEK